mmetsp:Transcript_22423/g.53388  ORF Transcript_22423/g.53388 Transcript_22423/m.53388 type:complete len:428 (-) Transcript_22423:586-1869(-)
MLRILQDAVNVVHLLVVLFALLTQLAFLLDEGVYLLRSFDGPLLGLLGKVLPMLFVDRLLRDEAAVQRRVHVKHVLDAASHRWRSWRSWHAHGLVVKSFGQVHASLRRAFGIIHLVGIALVPSNQTRESGLANLDAVLDEALLHLTTGLPGLGLLSHPLLSLFVLNLEVFGDDGKEHIHQHIPEQDHVGVPIEVIREAVRLPHKLEVSKSAKEHLEAGDERVWDRREVFHNRSEDRVAHAHIAHEEHDHHDQETEDVSCPTDDGVGYDPAVGVGFQVLLRAHEQEDSVGRTDLSKRPHLSAGRSELGYDSCITAQADLRALGRRPHRRLREEEGLCQIQEDKGVPHDQGHNGRDATEEVKEDKWIPDHPECDDLDGHPKPLPELAGLALANAGQRCPVDLPQSQGQARDGEGNNDNFQEQPHCEQRT